jgi:hypothetical protein
VLERALVLGQVSWFLFVNAAYLLVMGLVCMRVATKRLAWLLQP